MVGKLIVCLSVTFDQPCEFFLKIALVSAWKKNEVGDSRYFYLGDVLEKLSKRDAGDQGIAFRYAKNCLFES